MLRKLERWFHCVAMQEGEVESSLDLAKSD